LDKLCHAGDSKELEVEGKLNFIDGVDVMALDEKLLHLKRSKAFTNESTAMSGSNSDRSSGYLTQDELDTICKQEVHRASTGSTKYSSSDSDTHKARKASTTSTKCSTSSDSGSDENLAEDDSQEEEEEAVHVKKKKERAYLEKPRTAPHTGLCLGFSQAQLDYLTGHDDSDHANVPDPQSSPHGSALTAIKRAKFYHRDTSDRTMPASRVEQTELDALCVGADDSGKHESCMERDSQPSSAILAIKRSRGYKNDSRRAEQVCPEPYVHERTTPAPIKTGTDQAELDALCVDAEDSDVDPNSPRPLAKKVDSEEEEQQWSPFSPHRSNESSPRGAHGRSKSPVHGGA